MSEIIPTNENNLKKTGNDLDKTTEELLADARIEGLPAGKTMSMPIAGLAALGAGVSELVPAFRTVTDNIQVNTSGLYRLVNANPAAGDVLKMAKDGNYWGSYVNASGESKFLKIKEADPLEMTQTMTMRINPAMVMVAAALYSIDKELGEIKDMTGQILSFLQREKEAEIEADVITVTKIIEQYRDNWDNEHYISSNHQKAVDIKQNARKNMISYEKKVGEILHDKKLISMPGQADAMLKNLTRDFKYYRLSLYTFGLASLAETLLSENCREESVAALVNEVRDWEEKYRMLFAKGSVLLEKTAKHSIKALALKSAGAVAKGTGNLIGSIPKVRDGQVDEFLVDKGKNLKSSAGNVSDEIVESFAEVSNPNVGGIISRMEDMIRIYDKTTFICFDKENIYLVAE